MNTFKKLFRSKHPVIGMIHLQPLLGYEEFTSIKTITNKALKDLYALESGGVDAIIIENNYDIPHEINVKPGTIASMTSISQSIKQNTKLPVGICVLWNDFESSFAIAKTVGADFIRIPVFVDTAKTSYGVAKGNYKNVMKIQKKLKAENILMFTDIHVKHAEIINKDNIEKSALKAIRSGSDALIITGKWTADAPLLQDLKNVRQAVKNFPILIGSGATEQNAKSLLTYSNGIIVGTALKTGRINKENVNMKSYNEHISLQKVRSFVDTIKII